MSGRLLGGVMDLANRKPTRIAVDLLDPQDGERILDAGCGTGIALERIAARAKCHLEGLDPSRVMLERAAARLPGKADLHCTTIEAAAFAHGFDAILALNVLYFCDESAGMVRALHRMLTPGGRLVAYVSHRASMEGWSFTRAGYHRLYDPSELLAMLVKGGFAADKITIHEASVSGGVTGLFALAPR